MKKAWSISTTVRNPERILPFLTTLAEMEGEGFGEQGQIKFQTLLIKNKLYKPEGLNAELTGYYDSLSPSMSFNQAEKVFQHMLDRSEQLRASPGLRGRTSAAPITKMGLAAARQSDGVVQITDLGRSFIDGAIDIGEVYFRFFLKWQIPTPGSNDFSDDSIYDIKPFIGTLHLIGKVNELARAEGLTVKGLSKTEFGIFAHTLVNSRDIDSYAEEIIKIRKLTDGKALTEARQIFAAQSKQFVSNFLDSNDSQRVEAFYNTLLEYGDNSIRYFRLTRYVYIRGGGFYIDLEPRRSTEIKDLLKFEASSGSFDSAEDYAEFMADAAKPEFPWETKDKLQEILRSIYEEIDKYQETLGVGNTLGRDYSMATVDILKSKIEDARRLRRNLQEQKNHKEAASIESVDDYIEKLNSIFTLENRPIQFEKYASLSLHALNDALAINPNYPVGDDNEPTFTAPANVPDIECYYENANSICEVTMLTTRDQYYNEGQPVMRHLRDFEDINSSKPTYCLFIAPTIHRDTINTYWTAVKYEYEGVRQKIVPLTIGNFVRLLETLSAIKSNQKKFRHSYLFDLYDKIVDLPNTVSDSSEWLEKIPEVIDEWSESTIALSR